MGRLRTAGKLADLSMALAGRFTDHHALMCRLHLDQIKRPRRRPSAAWTGGSRPGPRRWQRGGGPAQDRPRVRRRACAGPGWPRSAPPRTSGSPRHEKLASWVTLCPGNNISARKRKHGRTGDAGTYIKPMLVQAAWAAIRVRGRLQARYNRLVRRFGGDKNPGAKKKAIIAIAHTLLKIAYQVLKTGSPVPGPGRGLLHPPRITRPAAGLPGTPAPKAPPRLHHHRHHQPAAQRKHGRRAQRRPAGGAPAARPCPGGRLNPGPPPTDLPPLTLGAALPHHRP